jgi:peptide-methionine (S)-S-oxide reductase
MLLRHISTGLFITLLSVGAVAAYRGSQATISGTAAPSTNSSQTSIAIAPTKANGLETAVFAGGCFWGVEAVFEQLTGVSNVVSGYSGGSPDTANYETVSHGATGHAEAVQITYDPKRISYEQLLKVFFTVAHDPTELNRQGPDTGTQYRSAIFFTNQEQERVARAYISQLDKSRSFSQPIVTQMAPLQKFYAAEDYHQNFLDRNPTYPYIVIHDLPKLDRLRQEFPKLVKGF